VPARPPLTARMHKQPREAPGGARVNLMGKRSHEIPSNVRYKPLVEVDLLAHVHSAFLPRLMYYNV
jgi:hypothetical protein